MARKAVNADTIIFQNIVKYTAVVALLCKTKNIIQFAGVPEKNRLHSSKRST